MRVAVVEWYPRVCGSTEWGLHFASGSPNATLLSFTRSGRPMKDWAFRDRWQTHKIEDAVDVLNTYDLVVAIDLVCFAPKLAGRKRELPYYVDVLANLKTPWTAMYHGGLYPSKYDPVIAELVASKAFTNRVLTTRLPQAKARLAGHPGLKFVHDPFLPHDPAVVGIDPAALDAEYPKRAKTREVIMTSRIAVNKGQNVLVELLPELRGDVHLWGYNAWGLPSIGWRLYELARSLGYSGDPPKRRADTAHWKFHPHAIKFFTGEFSVRTGGRTLRYHDAFARQADVDWSPWVHATLTSGDFRGTLEYVTLNAIEAGCVAVVPDHAIEDCAPRYRGDVFTVPFEKSTRWGTPGYSRVTGELTGDPAAITRGVNHLLTSSDAALKKLNARQRETIRELHSPKRVFNKLIRGVLK
jgi:glycosyltransferase involved in cell wall biosynthesis